MNFSSDANANFEGLLEVNRGICMPQMAEKTSSDAPSNCAVVPLYYFQCGKGAGEFGNSIIIVKESPSAHESGRRGSMEERNLRRCAGAA